MKTVDKNCRLYFSPQSKARFTLKVKSFWDEANKMMEAMHLRRKSLMKSKRSRELTSRESKELDTLNKIKGIKRYRPLPYPKIDYVYPNLKSIEDKGTAAYAEGHCKISFNVTYIRGDYYYMCNEIIPHEIAHCFIDFLYSKFKLKAHCRQWQSFATRLAKKTMSDKITTYLKADIHNVLSDRIGLAMAKKKS